MAPSFYGYNAEREDSSNMPLYIKAILFGGIVAVILIGLGKGFYALINFFVTHWVWVVGLVLGAILIKQILSRKKVQSMRIVE